MAGARERRAEKSCGAIGLPQDKPNPPLQHFKSARDTFTTAKAITMLIGLILGGILGTALGMQANLMGAFVGVLLGAAAGLTVGISIWH